MSHGDVDRTVELVLRFARAGHEAGYPTADLEERLLGLARAVGQADAQVSATPTLVEVSLRSIPEQRSYTIRVRPRAVDLDAIARLDELIQDVVDGRRDAERALDPLAAIRDQPLERPWPLLLGAYALAGAALTPVLGGGWREVLAAVLIPIVPRADSGWAMALPLARLPEPEPSAAAETLLAG